MKARIAADKRKLEQAKVAAIKKLFEQKKAATYKLKQSLILAK